ncbi:MAG: response regulator [Nitrososphaerota archaeon]
MPKETAGSSTSQGKPTLLIIEDDEDLALQMKWALGKDYFVCVAHDGPSAMKAIQENKPKIVTLDLGLPPSPGGVDEGFRVLSGLLDQDPSAKVIVITGRQEREYGLKAVSIGAYDYMTKPIDVEELKVVLKRALHLKQLEEEYKLLEAQVHTRWDEMIWSSKAMEQVWIKIQRVAPTDAGVLILGETGTGKTRLLYRFLWMLSDAGYSGEITVIDMAPGVAWGVGAKLMEVGELPRSIRYLTSWEIRPPRLIGKDAEEVKRLARRNMELINPMIEEYIERPTKILAINDSTIFIHAGEPARLLIAIQLSRAWMVTAYSGARLADDKGTGISAREREFVAELLQVADIIIRMA